MPFLKTGDFTTTIYEYNRGDKTVKVDPAIVWRKLNIGCRKQGETFDQLMSKWNDSVVKEGDTEEEVDHKIALFADLEPVIEKITRDAFNIPELDEEGRGGTVALVLATLNDFLSDREKKREYGDLAVFITLFGWGPPGFIEGILGVERLTYEVFYGLLLNKQLAIAAHSLPVSWGVHASMNGLPNLMMFEAESEFSGEDAGQRMNQAMANLRMQEGVNKFREFFGGNGRR